MRIHKNETYIEQKLYYLLHLLKLGNTFNCYINNLAFPKTSKGEKKDIRVENKSTWLYASLK